MDRLGIRRVMIVFAVLNGVIPLFSPILSYIWAPILLQVLAGLETSTGTVIFVCLPFIGRV